MWKRVLRLQSFLVKEIIDVLQQPRLVVTLIVGPFLILLVFGLGFTGKNRPVDTILVVPPGAELPEDLTNQVARYEDFMPIRAIVGSRDEAMEQLTAGDVDLVAVLPKETYSAFLAGEQIVIDILINEYDPVREQWVSYISGFMVNDLNRQLLAEAFKQGKVRASRLQGISVSLLDRLILVGEAAEAGDLDLAKERLDEILTLLDQEREGLGLGDQTADYVLPIPGGQMQQLVAMITSLRELRDEVETLRQELDHPDLDVAEILAQVKAMRAAVTEMKTLADLLGRVPIEVLVSPLKTEIENVSLDKPSFLAFYSPALLALLLQHIAVTFGALTMVRERLLGAEELFRVAPIAPWEIITGKYLSYCLLIVAIGLTLSVLIVLLLHVPLLGSVFYYVLVLVLLTVASLGWGFFLSLLSNRESQSVQFSMLILIASVFFSGFFLSLSSLLPAVHFVSGALPVTYGIQALRDIMLAGGAPGLGTLLPLAGLGLGFYAACILLYTWQSKRE